jgi:hypothetical protein
VDKAVVDFESVERFEKALVFFDANRRVVDFEDRIEAVEVGIVHCRTP